MLLLNPLQSINVCFCFHFFQLRQSGTYWYHSHIGSQRTNGVYGAFIIKKRYAPGVVPPIDMIMTVGDWHHEDSDSVSQLLN